MRLSQNNMQKYSDDMTARLLEQLRDELASVGQLQPTNPRGFEVRSRPGYPMARFVFALTGSPATGAAKTCFEPYADMFSKIKRDQLGGGISLELCWAYVAGRSSIRPLAQANHHCQS